MDDFVGGESAIERLIGAFIGGAGTILVLFVVLSVVAKVVRGGAKAAGVSDETLKKIGKAIAGDSDDTPDQKE